jgi:hypothetical protein
MATIKELASEMRTAFVQNKRDNGDQFYHLKEGSPQWMSEVVSDGHKDGSPGFDGTPGAGTMLPDDLRYEMIREVLSIIEDTDGDEENARDALEAPIYTHELTGWLASRNDRYGYCDEFLSEFGSEGIDRAGSFTTGLLQGGYMMELEEVFANVFNALSRIANPNADEAGA